MNARDCLIIHLLLWSLPFAPLSLAQSDAGPGPAPIVSSDPFLVALDAKFRVALEEQVEVPHEVAVTKLKTEYLGSLTRGENSVREDLETVVAWRNEQRRIRGEPPLEESRAKPEALERLRTAYEEQIARLDADRNAKKAALFAKYAAALEEREKELTRDRRIEEALVVKKWRESLVLPASPDRMAKAREVRFEGTFEAVANVFVQDGQIWIADRSVAEIPEKIKVNGRQWKPEFGPDKVSEKLAVEPGIALFAGSPVKLMVRKRGKGDGIVEIMEQPSSENGQMLTIFLNEVGGGAGEFEFMVSW